MSKIKQISKKPVEYKISLKDLLDAGCHFGHQARRWNPKMGKYIFTKREGVHIFDLGITGPKLAEAMTFVRDLVAEKKELILVGTKRQASAIIKEEALRVGAPYISIRWMGGIVTNWEQIKKSLDRIKDLEAKKAKGELKKYTKKENLLIDRDIAKVDRFLGGLRSLTEVPAAVFIVDVKKEIAAVKEARTKGLTVVGIVDTNADPDLVDFPIPANDDAVSSIKFIVGKICQAYQDGKKLQKKDLANDK